ncbi:MAG: ethanolamine utilization protein EutJ [Oscillospiraceae bacterium]|jgi:ethanolamine utilization protein EutJ|nr:ethanolamine utilization protein EutJ [Oscillospiraceae bacterium]
MDWTAVNTYIEQVERSEKQVLRPPGARVKVGVDLGTAYIVIVALDEDDNPIACEKRAANVLRDGVVVDYIGARRIVGELKAALEARIGRTLTQCAIAMPAGTESSTKTHIYVAEGAGFEVVRVLDEPTAANALYRISNGAIVDIGGGTTGLAVFRDGRVVRVADEATGGVHLTLVLSGHLGVAWEEAERLKMERANHKKILPIVTPVLEKMASIVKNRIDAAETGVLYLCGGTCCMTGIEQIFEKHIGIPVCKPANPFLVTPAGIAMNCVMESDIGEGGGLCSSQS